MIYAKTEYGINVINNIPIIFSFLLLCLYQNILLYIFFAKHSLRTNTIQSVLFPSHKEDRHVTLFCLVISSLTLTNCWLFTQKRIMMMIWSVCLIYLRFLSISCASIYGKNCYRNFNTQKKIIESEVKNIFGTQSIPAKN